MANKKGKIKVKQSVRLSSVRNNAAVIGHKPAMSNAAMIKVKVSKV